MIEAIAGFAGEGDGGRDERRRAVKVELALRICRGAGIGTGERDQLTDTFCSLLDGPVVAKADDQRSHFGMRPAEGKIVAIEGVCHHLASRHPYRHPRVVVEHLVEGQREISKRGSSDFVPPASRLFFFDQFAEHLDGGAVAQELPRGEQVAPEWHAVLNRTVVIDVCRHSFGGDHVHSFPVWKLLCQSFGHCLRDIVFRTGRAVTPYPLFLGLAGLRVTGDQFFLEDHGVELFTHASRLRFGLDVIAGDQSPAVIKRAGGVTTGDRTRRLFLGFTDDCEAHVPGRVSRSLTLLRQHTRPSTIRSQTPVGRERDKTLAVRTADRACPNEIGRDRVFRRFGREKRQQALLPPLDVLRCNTLELAQHCKPVFERQLNRGVFNQGCDRIEVVAESVQT